MNLMQLDAFLKFADTKSVTEAAEKIGISQPRMSQRLREFEQSLEVKLLVRKGRNVALSPAGVRLIPYAREILRLCDEASAAARGQAVSKRRIRIGAPESVCTYFLPPGIEALRRDFPDTTASLFPASSENLMTALRQGDLDMAFVLAPAFKPSGLQHKALAAFELVPFSAPQQANIRSPRDFRANCVFLTENGCSYRQMIERRFTQLESTLKEITELTSVEAIKSCVEAGGGVSILPSFALKEELKARRLKRVALNRFKERIVLQAMSTKDNPLSQQIDVVVQAVENAARQQSDSSAGP